MSDDPAALRRLAEELAREAGTLADAGRRRVGADRTLDHDTKSTPTDPVTEYDRAAEAAIVSAIRERRPHDAIVGEEGSAHAGTSGLAWHIDPIDGTVNFVYGLPMWCTSVAVVDDRGGVAGAVFAPVTGELFSAARGAGATLDGAPLSCSVTSELSMALVATGFNYSATTRAQQASRLSRLLPVVRDVRRYGSAALDLCLVASGRLDAYFEEHLNSWDLAAGVLIAAEAGATCTDFADGVPSSEATLVAAPGVHAALRDTIRRLDSERTS